MFFLSLLFVYATASWDIVTYSTSTPIPPGRRDGNMWCSVTNDDIYLFGGKTAANVRTNDFWKYSNNVWTLLTVPSTLSKRSGASNWNVQSTLYLFGGRTDTSGQALDSFWKFSNNQWSEIAATTPPPLYGSAFWSFENTLYMYGGKTSNNSRTQMLYAFDTTTETWRMVPYTGIGPGAIDDGVAVDMLDGENVVQIYGGSDNSEVYELNLATFVFSIVPATLSTAPPAKEDFVAWKCNSDTTCVFGGRLNSNGMTIVGQGTWKFTSPIWSETEYEIHPSSRRSPMGCRKADAYFMFGGMEQDYYHNDLWVYSSLATTTPSPVLLIENQTAYTLMAVSLTFLILIFIVLVMGTIIIYRKIKLMPITI